MIKPSSNLQQLKRVRDEAWRAINPTLPHSRDNDWLPFAKANSEWVQTYKAECGECPESDAIDVESTNWYNRNKAAYTRNHFSQTRKSKTKKGK